MDSNNNPTNMKLFGNSAHMPHRHMEIVYKPCVPKELNAENFKNRTFDCLMEDSENQTKLE